jgi:hypothetical protein
MAIIDWMFKIFQATRKKKKVIWKNSAVDCGDRKFSIVQLSDKKVENLVANFVMIEFVFVRQFYDEWIRFWLFYIMGGALV